MNYEIDKPFDLEKIRLEMLSKLIKRALTEFEENPRIYWTQTPMEKPLWQALQLALEKQVPLKAIETCMTMQACPNCKTKVNWNFCSECGQKIKY